MIAPSVTKQLIVTLIKFFKYAKVLPIATRDTLPTTKPTFVINAIWNVPHVWQPVVHVLFAQEIELTKIVIALQAPFQTLHCLLVLRVTFAVNSARQILIYVQRVQIFVYRRHSAGVQQGFLTIMKILNVKNVSFNVWNARD